MGRARGANARLVGAFETTYGTPPASGFRSFPFVSADLGATQGLIEDDLLGQGREKLDPTPDVTNNDGNVVVPVDMRHFGFWLKLLFGVPVTTGDDPYTHTFRSGAVVLPSMSIETQLPDVPSFEMNYGLRGGELQIGLARSGLLNATVTLVGKGSAPRKVTTSAGTLAAALAVNRFRQAVGTIKRNGAVLGSIVSAQLSFTNNLEKVETIQPDGEIEDADAGQAMASGNIVSRFASNALYADAVSGAPVQLSFGWTQGDYSLTFTLPRAFLPRTRVPINGPNGLQSTIDFMASGGDGNCLIAALANDVESYA